MARRSDEAEEEKEQEVISSPSHTQTLINTHTHTHASFKLQTGCQISSLFRPSGWCAAGAAITAQQ